MRLLQILLALLLFVAIMHADTILDLVARAYGADGRSLATRMALLALAVPLIMNKRGNRRA